MNSFEKDVLRDLVSRSAWDEADEGALGDRARRAWRWARRQARPLVVHALRWIITNTPVQDMPPALPPPPAVSQDRDPSSRRGGGSVPPSRFEAEEDRFELLEHLGHAAEAAETDDEAEAFAGAMIPVAVRCEPGAEGILHFVLPVLLSGLAGAILYLRRYPRTRVLIRTLPTVVQRTVAEIIRRHGRGHFVSAQAARHIFARQMQSVLGSARPLVTVVRRSRALDGHFHRVHRLARPARTRIAGGPLPRLRVPGMRIPRARIMRIPRIGRIGGFRMRR